MKNAKFLIISFIVALAIPTFVSADTASDIQAQIQALMQQLKSLQEQLATIQQTSTTWCHDFNVNLKFDDSGSEVGALVSALKKEGFAIDTGESKDLSASFNESVASAVSGLQQKYADEILTPLGLQYGTGYVGSATRAKLNKLYGCGVTPPPFSCTQIACPSNQKTICPAGLDDKGCPLPCKCVPQTPCTEPGCSSGYTLYDTGEKDSNGCPIKRCIPSTGNQPPTISGVSGPTALKVNETGTWTVKASDPEQGTLSYSVFWGDETATGLYSAAQRNWSYTQTATFTHSFSQSGAYNPTFIVTDNQGLSAKTSISVQVGEIGTPSITVLSPNGGETLVLGQTHRIKWTGGNNTVDVYLLDNPTRLGKKIFAGITNNGYVDWTVSSLSSGDLYDGKTGVYKTPSGQYVIWVGCTDNNCTVDDSDAAFSIVAAPIVGGQCTYQSLVSACTITSINAAGTVGFNFTAPPNISFPSFFNPNASQQGDLATLTSGWTDTARNSLKVGSQVGCTVNMITGGTCTPVIFNFK